MIFDTHAHMDDSWFDDDRRELLESMNDNGVETIVNIAADTKSLKSTIKLVDEYDFVFGALGVHPDEVYDLSEDDYKWIEDNLSHPKIIAVGEIGMDYHREHDKNVQREAFERQMDIARRNDMPIVVHSRDAANDTYEIMKANNAHDLGGVIHCFSYEKEMARQFLDMNYYIGVGGVVTFKNGRKLKEVVEYTPIDRIVLETDAPYLAPVPFRGKRNDSRYIKYVAEEVARIKNMTYDEVVEVTKQNALKMYRMI